MLATMGRLEQIETEIQQLTVDELRALRTWFGNYEAELWDDQFERDIEAGKLTELAEGALRDHSDRKSTEV